MPKINQEEYELLKELDDKWKWIARDDENQTYSAEIYVFEERPKREDAYWNNVSDHGYALLEEWDDLFQFIQWEDEEPYNIQELIEEYERYEIGNIHVERKHPMFNCNRFNGFYNANIAIWDRLEESEETEVKKDIEWLKEEILGLRNDGNTESNQTEAQKEMGRLQKWAWNNCVDRVYELIDQLNEPEVLSQELPVIPKFVADWIESRKNNYPFDVIGVYQRMNESFANEQTREVLSWIHEKELNRNSFARAWLDGYEIEQEPRYYAKIKGHENIASNDKYWNYNTDMEELSVGDSEVHPNVISEYTIKATKEEWANLGITDDNAEFELVEELEG